MTQKQQQEKKPVSTNNELRNFDRSLPMSLLRAREAVIKKFLPSLRENELTTQQWRVIRALEQYEELELTELSEKCFILKPSMTRIIQNLEARKLILRQENKKDRRCSNVRLTPQAHELFKTIAPASIERYKFITEKFGYGKLELLYELLDELIDCLYDESDPSTIVDD
jgi:homoprotocatechuate degradation regulator HpaR